MSKRKQLVPTEPQAHAVWAQRTFLSDKQKEWTAHLALAGALTHWSRIFEYPWILANGQFHKDQFVLDAAGGDSPLQVFISNLVKQVINIDIDPNQRPGFVAPNILYSGGNLLGMTVADNVFDRVILASVLEHIENPGQVLFECQRVLKPGGRLIGSFDVADRSRHNHTIDVNVATLLLADLGLGMPDKPNNAMEYLFKEIDPQEGEPETVKVSAICFWWDKK